MKKDVKWTTFSGQKLSVSEMCHQHLSNILWYNIIIMGYSPSEVTNLAQPGRAVDRHDVVMEQINLRFGGEILPYRPSYKFNYEIDRLEAMGLVKWNEEMTFGEVYYNWDWDGLHNEKRLVGYIETLAWIRNNKLSDLLE